jgi:uncharacterized protein (TIGR03000 family)
MFRRAFKPAGTLLVAAALVFLTPGASQAAGRGGGFHGGGFHGGGFHGGGFHGGGFRAGGFHGGGFRADGFHGGGFRAGGYHVRGYNHHPNYRGWNHYRPSYGGYYGYYPYYYNYYPYYGYYPYDGDLAYDSVYDPGYAYPDTPPAQPYSASTSGAQTDTKAYVTVTVPADAQLWFEDTLTKTTGTVREFYSPPLQTDHLYRYKIRARWNDHGHEVTQTQQVKVTAGSRIDVRFPVPARTTATASVSKKN